MIARTALAAVALLVVACGGGDDDYANNPRPPAPIIVTAAITTDRVSVSPASFGAGPVTLVVTNQTDATQQITLRSAGAAASIEQSTGPVNPDETASLKVNLVSGEYTVAVASEAIDAASLDVGPERPSAQNELLQP